MSSLSEQLLKAGLVTKEQIKKAHAKPKPKKTRSPTRTKQQSSSEQSDLAQFYNERHKLEKQEQQAALKRKQEAARLKKERNQKTNKLIADNLLNDDSAEIRYNFVVGSTIKYLFVTEQQQQDLAAGKLAITFMGSKRSLIPVEIAEKIREINPDKIIISSK